MTYGAGGGGGAGGGTNSTNATGVHMQALVETVLPV